MKESFISYRILLCLLLTLGYVGEQAGFEFALRFADKCCIAAPTIVGALFYHGFGRPIFQENKAVGLFTALVGLWSALGYDEGSYKKEQNCVVRVLYQNPLLAFALIYAFMYPEIMFENPELSVALWGHLIYQFARTCHRQERR
jgi:hypothetical protein